MGVGGTVDPQAHRPGGIGRVDRVDVVVGDSATAGEDRTHRVGRVGDRRVQHRVAVGPSQAEVLRGRGDELLRPDAGRDGVDTDVDTVPASHPRGSRLPVRDRTDRGRVAPLGVRGAQGIDDRVGRRVARRADRAVHRTPSSADAAATSPASRSYGYGGGTNPAVIRGPRR